MVQVILFIVAVIVLLSKGWTILGALLGALGIAVIGGFVFMAGIAALGKR